MSDYTKNINLILPKATENYNIDIMNTNNRIIDLEIENKVNKVAR